MNNIGPQFNEQSLRPLPVGPNGLAALAPLNASALQAASQDQEQMGASNPLFNSISPILSQLAAMNAKLQFELSQMFAGTAAPPKQQNGLPNIVDLEPQNNDHANGVAFVLDHQLSPDSQNTATVQGLEPDQGKYQLKPQPTVIRNAADLNQLIDATSSNGLLDYTNGIDQAQKNSTGDQVINISQGVSRNMVYQSVANKILEAMPNGEVDNPLSPDKLQQTQTIATTLGVNPSLLEKYQQAMYTSYLAPGVDNVNPSYVGDPTVRDQVETAIVNYVDNRLDAPDSAYQKAQKIWQNETEKAAQNGTVVVVAGGNDHQFATTDPHFKSAKAGSEFNFFGMSQSVISVAASTTNDASGQTAYFSSRGGGGYNPTLAADGLDVPADAQGNTASGSSFAAPTVAATVAELLKANPNLTFDQIKTILQETAQHTGAPTAELGAGILNSQAALAEAAA